MKSPSFSTALPFDSERQPLAARLRPRTLTDIAGQQHILAPGRLLRRAIEADKISSLIFSGPPGTGKTTLAMVIAEHTRSLFLSVNAVLGGVKELREAIAAARAHRDTTNRKTLLFVDEVHRWNKSQQDALLPWVEDGLIVLIGATTENPFFEVNKALLSRSRVFMLEPLQPDDLGAVLDRALADPTSGYGGYSVEMTPEARSHLIATSSGDARTLLNAVELAVETSGNGFPPQKNERIVVDLSAAEQSIQQRAVLYDKDGDYHFDTISAFIKSIRGSDPDAALYWLARMIRAGESPRYVFRRMLISASEDIGLADPAAITVVESCASAFDRVGLPEGQFHLSQAALYLATTEKSNTTLAYFDALETVDGQFADDVPNHLRDDSRDGAELGHGAGYQYPHAYHHHWVAQQYLPESLKGKAFYHPGSLGWEGSRSEITNERRLIQLAAAAEPPSAEAGIVAPGDASAAWVQRSDQALSDELQEITRHILERAALRRNSRLLLLGPGVAAFVGPGATAVPGGLVSVWAPQDTITAFQATVGSSGQDIEVPQFRSIDMAAAIQEPPAVTSSDVHTGPWDRIVVRGFHYQDPERLARWTLSRTAEGGHVTIADVKPLAGTRLSGILKVPASQAALLERAEKALYKPPEERWGPYFSAPRCHQFTTKTSRFISGKTLTAWIAADTPLGAIIDDIATPSEAADLRSSVAALPQERVPWTRAHLILEIPAPDS